MSDAPKPFEVVSEGDIEIVHVRIAKMPYAVLEALQTELAARIDAGARKMVIDLAPVAFVDSFGIGVIVATSRKMSHAGGQLKLSGAGERVMMSLTITRLDRTLDIAADTEEALRSLRGEA